MRFATRSHTSLFLVLATFVIIALGAHSADASRQQEPGSVLVFPWFDSSDGRDTMLTVTNTNLDKNPCAGSEFRAGEVMVRFFYVDGDGSQIPEFSRFELLTPGDTLSVLTGTHDPSHQRGFVMVMAIDPNDWFELIDFDYLVGSARVIDRAGDGLWQYTPFAFQAIPETTDPCAPATPDADLDGAVDFDGIEYEKFPRRLMLDSFFEESGRSTNLVAFMSTAGTGLRSELELVFWNNRGQKFNRSFHFSRVWSGRLSEISTIVTNLNGDEEEFQAAETGWVEITGNRILDGAGNPVRDGQGGFAIPPVLGVFVQFISGTGISGGTSLHVNGEIDGLELPRGDEDPQDNG